MDPTGMNPMSMPGLGGPMMGDLTQPGGGPQLELPDVPPELNTFMNNVVSTMQRNARSFIAAGERVGLAPEWALRNISGISLEF